MKFCAVGAELFQTEGQTDIQTWRSNQSLFAILLLYLSSYQDVNFQVKVNNSNQFADWFPKPHCYAEIIWMVAP